MEPKKKQVPKPNSQLQKIFLMRIEKKLSGDKKIKFEKSKQKYFDMLAIKSGGKNTTDYHIIDEIIQEFQDDYAKMEKERELKKMQELENKGIEGLVDFYQNRYGGLDQVLYWFSRDFIGKKCAYCMIEKVCGKEENDMYLKENKFPCHKCKSSHTKHVYEKQGLKDFQVVCWHCGDTYLYEADDEKLY